MRHFLILPQQIMSEYDLTRANPSTLWRVGQVWWFELSDAAALHAFVKGAGFSSIVSSTTDIPSRKIWASDRSSQISVAPPAVYPF
jgi:hypothetical protein